MNFAISTVSKQVSLILALSMSLSSIALASHANYSANDNARRGSHWVISLGRGVMTADPGHSQNFPIVDPDTDSFYNYTASHNSNQFHRILTAFAGKQWQIRPQWDMQMGLGFSHSKSFVSNGTLVQGADIESSDHYVYHYSINNKQYLLIDKILFERSKFVSPFAEIGLGIAANKAYHFKTNVPPFLTFTRQYQSNTQTSFSYLLGAGLDFILTPQVHLGFEYRFTDLGQVRLGQATIDVVSVGGTLVKRHLLAHEVVAQISWLL